MYNVQVVPPIEFRRMKSSEVPKNAILKNIVHQNSSKITLGESAAYDLWYDSYSKMKFGNYEEMAKKHGIQKCQSNIVRTRSGRTYPNVTTTKIQNSSHYTQLTTTSLCFLKHLPTGI